MTVVVFDPSESDRAKANARAFHECSSTTFLCNEKACFKMPNLKLAVDLPGEDGLSLLLLHDTDEARWDRLSHPEPDIIVRYSGGRDRQKSEGEYWVRQRPITGEDDSLSADEAQQILSWARKVLQGGDPRPPAIMQDPVSVDHLSALSILSQGYLAVHAPKHGGEEKMKSALDQMGWSEDLLSDGLDAKIGEVVELKWWQVFEGEVGLIEKAKQEWGIDETNGWSTVEELLDRVTDEDGRIVDDQEPLEKERDRKLVADAYCALAERLGGEPCP